MLLWSFSRSTHLTLQSRKDKQDSSLKLIKQGPSSHAECCGLTESKPLKVGQYDHKRWLAANISSIWTLRLSGNEYPQEERRGPCFSTQHPKTNHWIIFHGKGGHGLYVAMTLVFADIQRKALGRFHLDSGTGAGLVLKNTFLHLPDEDLGVVATQTTWFHLMLQSVQDESSSVRRVATSGLLAILAIVVWFCDG